MDRRALLASAGGALLASPLAALAQQPGKVPRIGLLNVPSASRSENDVEALRAGLRDLGYVEGRNIVIEFRWAEGSTIGSPTWRRSWFVSRSTSS